jgi:hypothetical protein
MPPRFFSLHILLVGLVASLAWGSVLAQTQGSAWHGEPPAVARLLQAGDQAERRGQFSAAAERYCAAARFGSTEAQFRLGRLYRGGRGVRRDPAIGATLISAAAQQGHERARTTLGSENHPFRLPACLSGEAPLLQAGVNPDIGPVVDRGHPGRVSGQRQRYAELVAKLAPEYGIDPRFALAVARTESNFDPRARSPKNAQGLMQLIPDTAARFGVTDAFDPEQNVRGGLAYLRWLLRRFEGDVVLTAAAYNAGEGAVARFGGVPPYAETREYVRRILGFYPSARHLPPERDQLALASQHD